MKLPSGKPNTEPPPCAAPDPKPRKPKDTLQPLPHADPNAYAHALMAAAPQQVVWGTDWPHVTAKTPMPRDGDPADMPSAWVPDAALRKQVLVDNPARLYEIK